MKRVWILLIIFLVALVVDAHGQTPTVPVGATFSVGWDQPAPGPGQAIQTGYRIELNGTQVGQDITDPNARLAPMAAIANCGQNSIRVASLATGAQPSWSAPLTFGVTSCPAAPPGQLRIIMAMVRQPDGTYELRITAVEVVE